MFLIHGFQRLGEMGEKHLQRMGTIKSDVGTWQGLSGPDSREGRHLVGVASWAVGSCMEL